jgi:hypothetical protein
VFVGSISVFIAGALACFLAYLQMQVCSVKRAALYGIWVCFNTPEGEGAFLF